MTDNPFRGSDPLPSDIAAIRNALKEDKSGVRHPARFETRMKAFQGNISGSILKLLPQLSLPTNPIEGMFAYTTTGHQYQYWNGTVWVSLGGGFVGIGSIVGTPNQIVVNIVAGTATISLATNGTLPGTWNAQTGFNVLVGPLVVGTDPGGARIFRAGGDGLFSSGTNASTALNIGSGGAAPTAIRVAVLSLNAPHVAGFPGNARVDYQRNGVGVWLTGIDEGVSGAKGANTDFFWNENSTYRMALAAGGGGLGINATASTQYGLHIGGTYIASGGFSYGAVLDVIGNSASTTQITGIYVRAATVAAAFTSPALIGIQIDDAIKGAGSTITTQYGIHVASQTKGTTNYAIFTNSGVVRLGDTTIIGTDPGGSGILRVGSGFNLTSLLATVASVPNANVSSIQPASATTIPIDLLRFGKLSSSTSYFRIRTGSGTGMYQFTWNSGYDNTGNPYADDTTLPAWQMRAGPASDLFAIGRAAATAGSQVFTEYLQVIAGSIQPGTAANATLGSNLLPWRKLWLSESVNSVTDTGAMIEIRHGTTDDAIAFIHDGGTSASWEMGLGTGSGFDGLGWRNITAGANRFNMWANGQIDIVTGPLIVAVDPGGTRKIRVGGEIQLPNSNAIAWKGTGGNVDYAQIYLSNTDRLTFFSNLAIRGYFDTAGSYWVLGAVGAKTLPVDPYLYGAIGDGVADDTAALNAAISNTPAGGVMRLSAGKYKFTSTLTFSKRMTLIASNYNSDYTTQAACTLIKSGTFTGIDITGDDVTIDHIVVDGAVGNGGTGVVMRGTRNSLNNVSVLNQGGDGVRVGGSAGENVNVWRINNLITRKNGGHGLFVHDGTAAIPNTNAGTLVGIDAAVNGGDGIRCDNTIDNQFFGVTCQSNTGYGIHLVGTGTRKCQGNTFWFPYTEANTAGESILDANADYNVIWGARTGLTLNDLIVDNGTNNLILGHDATNVSGRAIKSTLKFTQKVRFDNTGISGYWDVYKNVGDRGLYYDLVTGATNVPFWIRNTGGGSVNVIIGNTDPGGSRRLRVDGDGIFANSGGDTNTLLNVGGGGAAATAIRQAILTLNPPTAGGFPGNARVDFQRNGAGIWLTGIDEGVSGAKGSNTDFFWFDSSYRMALAVGGGLGINGVASTAQGLRIGGTYIASGAQSQGILVDIIGNSGSTTQIAGQYLRAQTAAVAFTCAALIGLQIDDAVKGAGSTITAQYGLYVASQTQGTVSYAIYTNTGNVRFGDKVTITANGADITGGVTLKTSPLNFTAGADFILGTTDAFNVIVKRGGTSILTITTAGITLSPAVSKIVPGVTSLSHRNNADSADNFILTDAGAATLRSSLTISANGLDVTGTTVLRSSPLNFTAGAAFVLGTTDNNTLTVKTNALSVWQFDTSGNLKADTANGGTVQSRVGTTATVAKHSQILYATGGQNTVSITEVSFASFVLKGNSLNTDYQSLRITTSWLVNNTTGGTVKTKFGATDVSVDAPGAAMTITNVFRIVRTGAATQYVTGEETRSSGTLASQVGPTTAAETLSGDVTIDFRAFRANSGSATSVVLQYAIIEYLAA